MTWLADLRDKAGNLPPGPWRVIPAIPGSDAFIRAADDKTIVRGLRSDQLGEFIAACSPERVRALCEVAEAAQEADRVLGMWPSLPLLPEFQAMRDALAGLEPAHKEEV